MMKTVYHMRSCIENTVQLRNIMFNGKSCLPPQMTTCEEHKIQFRIPKRQIADLSEKEV